MLHNDMALHAYLLIIHLLEVLGMVPSGYGYTTLHPTIGPHVGSIMAESYPFACCIIAQTNFSHLLISYREDAGVEEPKAHQAATG